MADELGDLEALSSDSEGAGEEIFEFYEAVISFVEAGNPRRLTDCVTGSRFGHVVPRVISLALLRAAALGQESCLRELLKLGADVHIRNENNDQPLHLAVSGGYLGTQKTLLAHGADIRARNVRGLTALDIACDLHNGKSVACLLYHLNRHVALTYDERDCLLYTAMLEAAEGAAFAILKQLVEAGANVNLNMDSEIGTALHVACETGSVDCIDFLLDSGANIEALREVAMQTPLSRASQYGHVGAVKRLLQAGAAINRQTEECSNALTMACHFGHSSVVRVLLDNGANPHQYNHWGFTALFMAADDTATLREILNEKVNTNELVGERGEAAIHLAAVTGSVENVRLLLEHGSDINLLTMHNETALWLAVWRGHSDLVTMLLRLNCSINDCSNSCQVYAWDYLPVEIAIGNASFDIMKMLFRVGCSLRNPVYFDRDSEGSLPGIPWLRVRPEVLHFLLQYEPEQKWVKSFLQNPRSLKDLSRLVIRKVSSSSVRLEKEVHELPVPPSLQDYLLWPELGLD